MELQSSAAITATAQTAGADRRVTAYGWKAFDIIATVFLIPELKGKQLE